MALFESAKNAYKTLREQFDATPCDVNQCVLSLQKIKILMTQFDSFMDPTVDSGLMALSRDTLEIAALLAVRMRDIPAFERYMMQLKRFYIDLRARIPESSDRQALVGMHLMHLLSSDRIGEFHTELELIPIEDHENKFIKFSIELERNIMEGNYSKVVSAQNNLPSPPYAHFVSVLKSTVRSKIGQAMEKSYSHIDVPTALNMLMLSSIDQLHEFIQKNETAQETEPSEPTFSVFEKSEKAGTKWEITNNQIKFHRGDRSKQSLEAFDIMCNTIGYATELERIV